MKRIKCLIIDDEPIAIRILDRHLEVFPDVGIVKAFTQAAQALEYLRKHSVDLIFLDIEMPRMTGMEFLKSLKQQPAIIFTTAYRNYAVEAYDLDVVDYLLKPISLERLGRAIERYHERCVPAVQKQLDSSCEFINLKINKEVLRLPVSSIRYIESFGDYIIVYDQSKKYVSRERISQMEERLSDFQFIRIHRQYLVAVDHIKAVQGNLVSIGDKLLPVGRTYRAELRACIGC